MKTATHYAQKLAGKTVKRVRELEDAEMEMFGWYRSSNPTAVIEFTDGTYVVIFCDPEGNGPGFLEIGEYEPQ